MNWNEHINLTAVKNQKDIMSILTDLVEVLKAAQPSVKSGNFCSYHLEVYRLAVSLIIRDLIPKLGIELDRPFMSQREFRAKLLEEVTEDLHVCSDGSAVKAARERFKRDVLSVLSKDSRRSIIQQIVNVSDLSHDQAVVRHLDESIERLITSINSASYVCSGEDS